MQNFLHGLKPIMLMAIVQVFFAGVNIFYKLAANDGMNLRVLVAYRFLFAAASIAPLAFIERKSRQKLTRTVLGQGFLCGLFGGALCQNLFLETLVLTSATFASAMSNLVPAATFILAIVFGLENVSTRTVSGRAKIMGTVIGIAGAMLMTLYKGVEFKLWSTHCHLKSSHVYHGQNAVLGALASLGACLSYAAWLIVQAKMSENYPSYSSAALMSVMAAAQSIGFALCVERDWSQWKLGWNIRLLTVAYSGIFGSGLTLTLIAWCLRLKGPLFVSTFNPLLLILMALAGSLILDEKLYLGSVLGATLIVLGLYAVLWGKGKEIKKMRQNDSNEVIETMTYIVVDEEYKVMNNGNVIKKESATAGDVVKGSNEPLHNDGVGQVELEDNESYAACQVELENEAPV